MVWKNTPKIFPKELQPPPPQQKNIPAGRFKNDIFGSQWFPFGMAFVQGCTARRDSIPALRKVLYKPPKQQERKTSWDIIGNILVFNFCDSISLGPQAAGR